MGIKLAVETVKAVIVATDGLHNIAVDENNAFPPCNQEIENDDVEPYRDRDLEKLI